MSSFDQAVGLTPDGDGRWLAHAHPDHESINAMFGGWTGAVALNSILQSAGGTRTPSALTVNYLGAVSPGEDLVVEVTHVGGSRSIDHWRTELRATTDGRVVASATAVLTSRRSTDSHDQFTMPSVPDPDALGEYHAPGSQGQQTLIRPAGGAATSGTLSGVAADGNTAGSHWLRLIEGRQLDHLLLVYLADQYAPRSFCWGPGPRPSATITMSVYVHATAEELAAVGDDYVLIDAIGTRGLESTSGQRANIWSRQGVLIATTEQLCWYR